MVAKTAEDEGRKDGEKKRAGGGSAGGEFRLGANGLGWGKKRKEKVELGREGLFPVINAPERPEGSSRASHLPGNASTRQGEPRSALACQMARLP